MRLRTASAWAITTAIVAVCCATYVERMRAARDQGGRGQQGQTAPVVNNTRTTREQLERWMTELSNWGRWGKDDELGTLNLITPEKRKQAAALVSSGIVVRLGHDLLTEKAADNPA